MTKQKTCFIIMPITTPPDLVDNYHGGAEHFRHVLEQLFLPAVEASGMEPIKPISKGSPIIQAEIIQNIETSDLVLCDMSALNANVLFELGIRTALNKPVAVVKDDATPKVPFDTSMINCHTYRQELSAWEIDKEVERLKAHLDHCQDDMNSGNPLWTYFSLSARASILESSSDEAGQIALLNRQLESIRADLSELHTIRSDPQIRARLMFPLVRRCAEQAGIKLKKLEATDEGGLRIHALHSRGGDRDLFMKMVREGLDPDVHLMERWTPN